MDDRPRSTDADSRIRRLYTASVAHEEEHENRITGWVNRRRDHEHDVETAQETEEAIEADLPPTELSIEEDEAEADHRESPR